MPSRPNFLMIAAIALLHPGVGLAATEIRLWHQLEGEAGVQFEAIAGRFNASQTAVRVIASHRSGSIAEALLTARRERRLPDLVHADSGETAALLAADGVIKPLHRLGADTRERVDARAFLPAVAAAFSDRSGRMLAFPLNLSTAAFYWNKEVFRRAGVDPETAPATWRELQRVALKIQDAGEASCLYASAWPSWIHVDSVAAWHNQPLATRSNGLEGSGARLSFNGELLMRHVSLLSSWMKSHLFSYSGRGDEADRRFASGECAMLTSSSGAYGSIADGARFPFGVGMLPYYDEFRGAPFTAVVRGGGLWVIAGTRPAEQRALAKFLSYLTRAEVQADWHERTQFLPATIAGFEQARAHGHYAKHPGREVPVNATRRRIETNSRGLRVSGLTQIRTVIDEELEAVWEERKTPKEALDSAVERGNELLRRFEYPRGRR